MHAENRRSFQNNLLADENKYHTVQSCSNVSVTKMIIQAWQNTNKQTNKQTKKQTKKQANKLTNTKGFNERYFGFGFFLKGHYNIFLVI